MNRLELPEQLAGPWEHALILTYGANLPFFENALWNQFHPRCRNKIILADGPQFLEACSEYSCSGLVRHLNQRYVAEGVFGPHASHGKLILLTCKDRGRLLVGSGNLNLQGYASGGELFTAYEYSSNSTRALGAFAAVRELVDDLMSRGWIGPSAVRYIRLMWDGTPWLFQSPPNNWRPVCHNLKRSFLSQLQQCIGDEPVEEFWVLSPFYDREAIALERTLEALSPRNATLLIQPGRTSVEPAALRRVLNRFGGHCQVRSFTMGSENPYVHAKLYLLKLSTRAVCLQGSPNLSQVAMLLTPPAGNVEVANLLSGKRDAFDGLLSALNIAGQSATVEELDLRYDSTQKPALPGADECRLIGGDWRGDRLHLRFQGVLPDLGSARLHLGAQDLPLDICLQQPQSLTLRLTAEAVTLLGRPVPVSIIWGLGKDSPGTNPIFVCNHAVLDAWINVTDDDTTLRHVGDLHLDDAEIEELLAALDAALVIDHRSMWALVKKPLPAKLARSEDAPPLDYDDYDANALAQHPKLRQYSGMGKGERGPAATRLQIILNAITDHFSGLVEAHTRAGGVSIKGPDEGQAETEGERQQEDKETQRRRRSLEQRLRRIVKNFIGRYLRGIQSQDFQKLAGFEVMAQNYAVFSHLLWHLFSRDWVEREFVVESFLRTWKLFWGDDSKLGYFWGLPEDERALVTGFLQGPQHPDALMLAALHQCAYLSQRYNWVGLRFELRDFWRGVLKQPPFQVTAETLEVTWHTVGSLYAYEPPSPRSIVAELAALARFNTRTDFLQALEKRGRYPLRSCRFEKTRVYRQPLDRTETVDCLVVGSDQGLADRKEAISVLQGWMVFEDLDYYRIQTPSGNRFLYYEGLQHQGLYQARDMQGGPVDLGSIEPGFGNWGVALSELQSLAAQVANGLVLPVVELGSMHHTRLPTMPEGKDSSSHA